MTSPIVDILNRVFNGAALATGADAALHFDPVDLSSTDYTAPAGGAFVGTDGSGAVKVDTEGGETGVTIPAYMLPAGRVFPLRVSKIYKTGTAAENLCVLY